MGEGGVYIHEPRSRDPHDTQPAIPTTLIYLVTKINYKTNKNIFNIYNIIKKLKYNKILKYKKSILRLKITRHFYKYLKARE